MCVVMCVYILWGRGGKKKCLIFNKNVNKIRILFVFVKKYVWK